jgi:chromosome segregation ATPase
MAILREENARLHAELARRADMIRALRSEASDHELLIARLAAGDDPAAVLPTRLGVAGQIEGSKPGLSKGQAVAIRTILDGLRQQLSALRDDMAAHRAENDARAATALAEQERTHAELRVSVEASQHVVAQTERQLDAARHEAAGARAAADDWRARHDAVASRLAEVNAAYLGALEAVRDKGEALAQAGARLDEARSATAGQIEDLKRQLDRLEAERAKAASRDQRQRQGEEQWRSQYEAASARLAEVSAQHLAALDAVREKGEAQTAAIEAAQRALQAQSLAEARLEEMRAAATAQIAELQRQLAVHQAERLALLDGNRQSEEAWRGQHASVSTRLAEVSAQYRAALDVVREKGEAQSAAIEAAAQAWRAQGAAQATLAELQATLAERDERIAQLAVQLEQTSARLSDVSRDYIEALENVRRSGEGQTEALSAYAAAAQRVEALQATVAERDDRIAQLAVQLEQTSARLSDVSRDYVEALENVRRSGEGQTEALAAYAAAAQRVEALQAELTRREASASAAAPKRKPPVRRGRRAKLTEQQQLAGGDLA